MKNFLTILRIEHDIMILCRKHNSIAYSLSTFGRKRSHILTQDLNSTIRYFFSSKRQISTFRVMLIIYFLLNIRGNFAFRTYEERLIKQSAQIKVSCEMCKSIAMNFFVLFNATFNKKKKLLMIRSPWRCIDITINKDIL